MSDYTIGYIDIYKSGKGDYIGGALVTDRLGIPVEFRHTETVSPSKVQRILHGQALERYLKCETLAKCLLTDLEKKPSLLVVPDGEYFPLTRLVNYPFVLIGKANREPMQQHGDFAEVSESEIHLQVLAMRHPLRLRVDRKNAPTMESIKTIITDVGRSMDVLEPLSRVREALAALVVEQS